MGQVSVADLVCRGTCTCNVCLSSHIANDMEQHVDEITEGAVPVPSLPTLACCSRWDCEHDNCQGVEGVDTYFKVFDQTPANLHRIGVPRTKNVLVRRKFFAPHMLYRFNDCYSTLQRIGEGSHGTVHAVETRTPATLSFGLDQRAVSPDVFTAETGPSENETDRLRGIGIGTGQNAGSSRHGAVKMFLLTNDGDTHVESAVFARRKANFDAEWRMLARLDHPHIVKMYECFSEKSTLHIVLEPCFGGELCEYVTRVIHQTQSGIDELQGRRLFRQMLWAVCYLHSKRVIHRDIKMENFLLVGEVGSPLENVLKLCDFGTAVQLSSKILRPVQRIGTPSYMAPEIYANLGAELGADVWSLGVTLYLVLVGRNPFRVTGKESRTEVTKRIRRGNYDQQSLHAISSAAQNLIGQILVPDEAKRLTCRDAALHVWVTAEDSGTPIHQHFVECACIALREIKRFANLSGMEQLLLFACAQVVKEDGLVHGQAKRWHELFIALDEDRDGRLRLKEFSQGMWRLTENTSYICLVEIEQLAAILDVDCSGSIEWSEWIIVALLAHERGVKYHLSPEPLNAVFRMMDKCSADALIHPSDLVNIIDCSCEMEDSYNTKTYSFSDLEELLEIIDKR